MFPGGGGNPNHNMGIPGGYGMPPQNTNIISAAPLLTGSRFPMGMGMGNPMMGGMGMMGNPMMGNPMAGAAMFGGMVPNMGNQGNLAVQNQAPVQMEQPVEMIDPALRKVFVKNIPENTPDTFMESILKECGNIIQWKRTKDQKDRPSSFGYCEFDSMEAVLRCLRVMNNLKLLDNYLTIKASEKTEDFIEEWSQMKKREWEASKDQGGGKEEDFERYLQKDDARALENIHGHIDKFDVNKIREEKEKEEEKKEHPKEKERERRKKMQAKELEKNFLKELSRWEEYEDKIEREVRREREREREKERHREREKQELLERELDYDSDRERRRRADPKVQEQRKRARQKELEEDELERRKEQMEEEEKKRAQEEEETMEIEPPPELILPQMPIEEEHHPQPQPEKPVKKPRSAKFSFQPVEPAPAETTQQQQQPVEPVQMGGTPFQIDLNMGKKGKDEKKSAFNQEANDDDNDLYQRKPKLNLKLDRATEVKENVITMDLNRKEANIKFNVATPVPQGNAANADEQKKLSDLEAIVSKIPKTKADLFDYKLNWAIIATSDLVEKKVKPWLFKQSKEYIGQEEAEFVNIILKRLANRESPQNILKRVEKLLDEDAEDFVMKLWRMLIFESLKLEHAS